MKHLIIGTAGHVDHGKTSLVRLLTGTDCDTHQQEKERGITINLGFTHMELPNGESAAIIDVPGHKDFINTMIGGACGIDMVLLVIAADSGIMPQTIEHIDIIRSLGVQNGVIALTRSDLVDKELLELAEYEIAGFLEGTSLQDAPIVPVSSITGDGKEDLIQAISKTLEKVEAKPAGSLFRMYIDRIFSVRGHGSVVTGSVLNGSLSVGDELFLLPSEQQKLRVRSLERHGQPVERIVAGDRAAINLTGINREDFDRGMILSDKKLPPTTMIDVHLKLFSSAGSLPIWSNIVLITGTFSCQARMHLLNKDIVRSDDDVFAQVHLSKPAVLMNKDRFIIRNSSEEITLGGGIILEASPLHHRKRTPELVQELEHLYQHITNEDNLSGIIQVLLKKTFKPMLLEEVAENTGLDPSEMQKTIANKGTGISLYRDRETTILIHPHCDKMFRQKIQSNLEEHHKKNPLFAEGLHKMELAGKLNLSKSSTGKHYLKLLLQALLEEQLLDEYNETYTLFGYQPQYDKQSLEEIAWLENEILSYDDQKPLLSEIEAKGEIKKIPKHKLKTYLTWLATNHKIRYYKSDFIHTDHLHSRRKILQTHLAHKPEGMLISEMKEIISGTKKFRAFILEILEADQMIRIQPGTEDETRIFLQKTTDNQP